MKLSDIHIRDPFILPFEGKYYLFGSPGAYAWSGYDGFYCSVSEDLEEWTAPAKCFDPPAGFWATDNYWAPEVHYYKGRFYMLASFFAVGHMRATQILASDRPEGPYEVWSCPITPGHWMCLDGTLYVENGVPYMVFCHEWLQVKDGRMCCVRLTDDLKAPAGEPKVLFTASEPAWAAKDAESYITDGPFLHKLADGRLAMLWSSFLREEDVYVQALAVSEAGVEGPWHHCEKLVSGDNGGHGMLFTDFEGNLRFTMHAPNSPYGLERARLYYAEQIPEEPYLLLR